ncbi:hypothetical protein GGS23DRAFT_582841 [Durotheca rogersii]|uniref:uncharacterized protein n=1 Tax=Durotheca rogersii TaxID=419775 RepID=UPI002220ABEB|nr:uncharacterized protein GGS23DRAFT_582841 [Durotheca rogersii]KAI5860170.1 hypothetical protein GGS23DRAFT_582841 [Durotheca rogersii]
MAGSLAALKNLPCPAGKKCTAFQCLFKHDSDADATAAASQSTAQGRTHKSPTSSPDKLPSDQDQDQPRKRIKFNSPQEPPPSHPPPITAARSRPVSRQQKAQSEMSLNATHASEMRPGADKKSTLPATVDKQPRPSVRQAGRGIALSSSAKQKPGGSPASASASNTAAKPTVKPVPKQPESLNPRLLKSAPAQHETRLRLVKALHEQYVRLNTELAKEARDKETKKLVLSAQELVVKALDDEEDAAIKRYTIYANAIRNKISLYKRMTVAQWKEERKKSVEDNQVEGADKPAAPEPIVTGLTVPQEVEFLQRLVWPLDGLERYGYVTSVPSDDDIQKAREGVETSGNIEVCDRCTRRFQVFPGRREEDGALASNGTCTYHPGKTYAMERNPGTFSKPTRKYRCCHKNIDDESGGCTTAPTHVFKTTDPSRLAVTLNFAETPPNPDVPADRAVAFDCEMGYTVYGLELIRLTAVSWPNGEELLDVLVQPYGECMDLNTRYSGVRPEDMATAERLKPGDDHRPTVVPLSPSSSSAPGPTTPPKRKLKLAPSPKAARDLLFSLIGPKTPLLGHGLENDLNAVRVVHPTCVDTALLYPHKRGLPIRNGLRMLMETLLGRKIQVEEEAEDGGGNGNGNEAGKGGGGGGGGGGEKGHDSAEDARAAGELVRLMVRDRWKQMQMQGWSIKDGDIVAPDEAWTVVGGAKAKKLGV